MGWETRKGRRYYYQKVRIGGKVSSRYIGTGVLAELLAFEVQEDSLERLDWSSKKAQLEAEERESIHQQRQSLEAASELARAEGMQRRRSEWRPLPKKSGAPSSAP